MPLCTAAAALCFISALASFNTADAQTAPSPRTGTAQSAASTSAAAQAEFCDVNKKTYQDVITLPLTNEHKTPLNAVTFGVYRNMAAMRLEILAWAAKCDLTPYLETERNHLNALTRQSGVRGIR